jgi:dTDP-4-dehydrorhamnose 3,5-epimerase-like enzyme
MIAYDIPDSVDADYNEWIWVPPGFAHGNFFTTDSTIEYLCSGEYSPGCEGGISPLAADIDWSMCDPTLKADFDNLLSDSPLMSDKDRDAITLNDWLADERSEQFLYTS